MNAARATTVDFYTKGFSDAIKVLSENRTESRFTIDIDAKSIRINDGKIDDTDASKFISSINALQKLVSSVTEGTKQIDKLLYMMGVTKVLKYVVVFSLRLRKTDPTNVFKDARNIDDVIAKLPEAKKDLVESVVRENKENQDRLNQALTVMADLLSYEDTIRAELGQRGQVRTQSDQTPSGNDE